MDKMSVPRGWRCLSLLVRSRTGEDVTLEYSWFIAFEGNGGYFCFVWLMLVMMHILQVCMFSGLAYT